MRHAGMVETPAATAPAEVPDQSKLLADWDADDRRERATGVAEMTSGLWMLAMMFDLFAVVALVIAFGSSDLRLTTIDRVLIGSICGVAVVTTLAAVVRSKAARWRRFTAYTEAIAWAERQPFPVTGYSSWLACDKPLLDLRLRTPFDRGLFANAVRAIDPAIEVEAIDDHTTRIAVPAILGTRGRAVRYGNVPLLHRLFRDVVLPLHDEVGIERVELGGLVTRAS